MPFTRREFLATGATSAAVVSASTTVPGLLLRAAAATPKDQRDNILVVIQLSGGNDGINTVVPYGDDVYHRSRFATKIGEDQLHRIDDYVGFHPALEGFDKLIKEDRLSVIQGVGYDQPNRSHFESMDIWHTASREGGARQTGWLGRFFDGLPVLSDGPSGDVPGVHLGSENQPLALAGLRVHVPSIRSLDGFQLRGPDGQLRETIRRVVDAPRGDADDLIHFIQDTSQAALQASRRVREAIGDYQTDVEYPGTELAEKLRGVAQLIDAGLATRIYYVTIGGFDTHSEQSEAHAALLGELGNAVEAFLSDLARHGHQQRVLVMSFSEFGRRVKENASRGTDHGAAAPMFLAGGSVRGGLHGEHPSLTDLEDGDLRYHTDFRSVYATVAEDWLGVSGKALLGKDYPRLKLL